MVYSLIVYKGKILVSKKLENITKTKNDTLRHSSLALLLPLRDFSSWFAAILFYAQFLSLPLCDVIYVWSLTLYIILKIRNIIFQFLQCLRLLSFLYRKNKNHCSTCTYIKHTLFPESSTKNIKSSASDKELSTAVRNKKKCIVSTLINWLNFCSDMSYTSVKVII